MSYRLEFGRIFLKISQNERQIFIRRCRKKNCKIIEITMHFGSCKSCAHSLYLYESSQMFRNGPSLKDGVEWI